MRKYLRDILARQAAKLPEFESQTEAETGLSKWRDRILAILFDRAGGSDGPKLDYTAGSLLRLEDWYFRKTEGGNETLARGCSLYFGEVVVRTVPGAAWIVEEFPFAEGRFNLGVQQGTITMMLPSFYEKLHHPKNTKRNSMWRTYHHYYVPGSRIRITF